VTPSDRFTQDGALSFRSGPNCGQPFQWHATGSFEIALHDAAPRGYGNLTLSLFGGPTTPGASDQGRLTVAYGLTATRTPAGKSFEGGTTTSVMTGADASDHTTTAPTVPITVIRNYDTDRPMPGFRWEFSTTDGANYDVASFTATYNFLTPRS
jgi:hypothetical protein